MSQTQAQIQYQSQSHGMQSFQQSATVKSSKDNLLDAKTLIKKYKISQKNPTTGLRSFSVNGRSSNSQQELSVLIAQHVINNLIEEGISKGKITSENGKYSIGKNKNLSRTDLINLMATTFTDEIKSIAKDLLQNIDRELKISDNNDIIKKADQDIKDFKKQIKSLEKEKKQLVNTLERQSKELFEATYKQSRMTSQIRTETAQQQFQKENSLLQVQGLDQGLDQLKLGLRSQVLQTQQQRQNALAGIIQATQDSNRAAFDTNKFLKETELNEERNKIAQERLNTAIKANDIYQGQLNAAGELNRLTGESINQIINLNNNMNTGFSNLSGAMDAARTQAHIDADAIRSAINNNKQAIDNASAKARADAKAIQDAINDASAKATDDAEMARRAAAEQAERNRKQFEAAEAANRKEREDLAAKFYELNKKADAAAAAAKKAEDDEAKAAAKIPQTFEEARPEDIDDALGALQCGVGYPLYESNGQFICGRGCCYSKQEILERIKQRKFGRM